MNASSRTNRYRADWNQAKASPATRQGTSIQRRYFNEAILFLPLRDLFLQGLDRLGRGLLLGGLAGGQGLLGRRDGVLRLPFGGERVRLHGQVAERGLRGDGLVEPLARVVERVLLVVEIARRDERRLPVVRLRLRDGVLRVREELDLRVDGDRDGDPELLPGQRERGPLRGHRRKADREELFHLRGHGLHLDAQRVLLDHVIGVARRHVVEDDGPLGLAGDRVQAVSARHALLPLDHDVAVERDLRDRVRAGPPDLVVWHEPSPDYALFLARRAFHMRPAVNDLDLRDADRLGDRGVGARKRRRELPQGGRGGDRESGEDDGKSGYFHFFLLEIWDTILRDAG